MQQELSTVPVRPHGFVFCCLVGLFFWCDSNKIMGLMGTDCELPLKHQSKLFHSAISINLKITFVVGSSARALVLFLLCGVLGLREAVFLTRNNEVRGVYRSLQMAAGLRISSRRRSSCDSLHASKLQTCHQDYHQDVWQTCAFDLDVLGSPT